jgi:type IX secretion system PorP/SprF family membrane protein|tara:strand:+ start:227 stop:1123 length:897 start_codon:yes stop_codon:yes gene_type:complete
MKNIFHILFFTVFIFCGVQSNAQQLPQHTQYLFNDYIINPAIGGANTYFDVKANQRMQWVGIKDAPRTFIFSLNGPLNSRKVGLGGHIYSDITGPTRRTGGHLSYAYHFQVTRTIKLGLGLSGGISQFLIDGSQIDISNTDDVALSKYGQSVVVPEAGVGLYLRDDKFFVGISSPQVLNSRLQFFDDNTSSGSQLARHFFLVGGYEFEFGVFKVKPFAMAKYVTPFFQFEAGVQGTYMDMVWLGVNFRQGDGLGVLAGYKITEHFSFGYSYDIPITNISIYSIGSHEIVLQMKFHDQE